jgi:hypothetical protein
MTRASKKRQGAVEVADPNLGRSGIKVESVFFVYLDRAIRSGKDLDADRRSSGKRGRWVSNEPAFLSGGEQDDIGDSDLAIASKDRLLDCGQLSGVKLVEEIGNGAGSLAMIEARRWRHNELPGRVDLKAFRPICKSGIAANFKPPPGGRSIDQRGHGMACGKLGQSAEAET